MEAVAHALFAEDQLGVAGVVLQLFAQVADVQPKVVAGLDVFRAPHASYEAAMTEKLPRLPNEASQEPELNGRQVNLTATLAHGMILQRDVEVADAERGGG